MLYSSRTGLEVLPVLNKIDLPQVEPERVIEEIEDIIGIEAVEAPRVSAKTGVGIEELLATLCDVIPAQKVIVRHRCRL